jgi:hypothetical protein
MREIAAPIDDANQTPATGSRLLRRPPFVYEREGFRNIFKQLVIRFGFGSENARRLETCNSLCFSRLYDFAALNPARSDVPEFRDEPDARRRHTRLAQTNDRRYFILALTLVQQFPKSSIHGKYLA